MNPENRRNLFPQQASAERESQEDERDFELGEENELDRTNNPVNQAILDLKAGLQDISSLTPVSLTRDEDGAIKENRAEVYHEALKSLGRLGSIIADNAIDTYDGREKINTLIEVLRHDKGRENILRGAEEFATLLEEVEGKPIGFLNTTSYAGYQASFEAASIEDVRAFILKNNGDVKVAEDIKSTRAEYTKTREVAYDNQLLIETDRTDLSLKFGSDLKEVAGGKVGQSDVGLDYYTWHTIFGENTGVIRAADAFRQVARALLDVKNQELYDTPLIDSETREALTQDLDSKYLALKDRLGIEDDVTLNEMLVARRKQGEFYRYKNVTEADIEAMKEFDALAYKIMDVVTSGVVTERHRNKEYHVGINTPYDENNLPVSLAYVRQEILT